jgi:hypothetical protein
MRVPFSVVAWLAAGIVVAAAVYFAFRRILGKMTSAIGHIDDPER